MLDTGPCSAILSRRCSVGVVDWGGRDWLWLSLSVVEQRLDAVRAVLAGRGGDRGRGPGRGCRGQSVHRVGGAVSGRAGGRVWRTGRTGRRRVRIRRRSAVEVAVAEMRREHPRWGAKRIRMELLRRPPWPDGVAVPSERDDRTGS